MPDPFPAPALPRAQVAPAVTPASGQNSLLLLAVVVGAALYVAREVLIPVTIAVLLSFLLAPLIGLLRRARLWRTPAVLLAVIVALGVIIGIGGAIGTQIASLVGDIPQYSTTIENKVGTARDAVLGRFNVLISRLGHPFAGAT